MKKSYKIVWGALTPMPIVMIVTGVICLFAFILKNIPAKGVTPSPEFPGQILAGVFLFYGLLLLGVLLGFLIHISYFIHLVRKEGMDKNTKTLWVVLFLVVNILAMIVYWFMVVLPEPEPGQAIEELEDAPVRKIRKR